MPELTSLQEVRLKEIAHRVKVTMGELRDAAATSLMHDAKSMARGLYLQVKDDQILPRDVREELVRHLESAWRKAVSGGVLFERTHGAIKHLVEADLYISALLPQEAAR